MQIPKSHRDLIEGPYYVCLSTVAVDGQTYSAPAWCLLEGGTLLIILAPGAKPESHIQRNTLVSLLVYDPRNPLRNMEIRGYATGLISDCEQLDQLAHLYSSKSAAECFYSQSIQDTRHPTCIRITPERLRVEGSS